MMMVQNYFYFYDNEDDDVGGRLYEYNLSTPYDVSTLSLVTYCRDCDT